MLEKRGQTPGPVDAPHKSKRVSTATPRPTHNPLTHKPLSEKYFKLLEGRSKLPAFAMKEKLLKKISESDFLIIQGETGSGKTTQVPQFLLESDLCGEGMVACTQPRRIAAISVAKRVAEESDTVLGEQVGYCIRFDDKSSKNTRLKYLTDGMLIRELILDRWLSKYSVVIIDEAHERTLNTDVLLPILKDLVLRRNRQSDDESLDDTNAPTEAPAGGPLKLIVMSATLDIDRYVRYFDGKAPVVTISGRQHPVEVVYSEQSEPDYLEAVVKRATDIHFNEPPGDILIFLTGEEEIENTVAEIQGVLEERGDAKGAVVLPLFGSMSIEHQQRVFEETPGRRKIVVATNIAETSITIDGIVYVIDSGLSKQKVYNPRFQFESLLVSPISKSSAQQRMGRAGRTRPGKCFRLYTENSFKGELPEFSIPEILRSELSGTILNLFTMGITNLKQFDWLEAPSVETVFIGIETLINIGAIDPEEGSVTLEGKSLGQFPLEPRLAKVLLKAKELSVVDECLDAIAVITTGNWKIRPHKMANKVDKIHSKFTDFANCDIMTTHNVFKQYATAKNKAEFCRENFLNLRVLGAAANVKHQLRNIVMSVHTILEDNRSFANLKVSQRVKVSFLAGFYQQVGHLMRDGSYNIIAQGHYALVHPGSTIHSKPPFIMYLEFVLTSKNYLRMVSEVDPEWLLTLHRNIYEPSRIKLTDTKRALERALKDMEKRV